MFFCFALLFLVFSICFFAFFGYTSAFTRFWAAAHQKLVKHDLELKNAKQIEKTNKNNKKQKQTMIQRLLGEVGAPAHPGVSETLAF